MSGYSETVDCSRCGSDGSLEASIDRDDIAGTCLECGYEYHVVHSVLTLDEVNKERKATGLEPISALKPPLDGWRD